MTKKTRSGGKYCRNHTTVTTSAATLCDFLHSCGTVTKIFLGHISGNTRSRQKTVKVSLDTDTLMLFIVKGDGAVQEIRADVSDSESLIGLLKEELGGKKGWEIQIAEFSN